MFHVALEDKPLIIEKDTRRVLWIRMKQNNEGKSVYQQGLLALHKVRQNGQQRITVQYVNVSHGSQGGHRKCSARPCRWLGEFTQYERELKGFITCLPECLSFERADDDEEKQ